MTRNIAAAGKTVFDEQQRALAHPLRILDNSEGLDPRIALSVQLDALAHWRVAGEEVGGWKAASTSHGSLSKDFRPFGYVLKSRMFSSASNVPLNRIAGARIEPEICLILDKPLGGSNVTSDEARHAVGAIAPAFEILESRLLSDVRRLSVRIADNLGQWGIVVGEHRPPTLDLRAVRTALFCDEALVDEGTSGPELIDDPYLSLARICAELSRFDISLNAGDHIITGSILTPQAVTTHQVWTAQFSELGQVSVTFT